MCVCVGVEEVLVVGSSASSRARAAPAGRKAEAGGGATSSGGMQHRNRGDGRTCLTTVQTSRVRERSGASRAKQRAREKHRAQILLSRSPARRGCAARTSHAGGDSLSFVLCACVRVLRGARLRNYAVAQAAQKAFPYRSDVLARYTTQSSSCVRPCALCVGCKASDLTSASYSRTMARAGLQGCRAAGLFLLFFCSAPAELHYRQPDFELSRI